MLLPSNKMKFYGRYEYNRQLRKVLHFLFYFIILTYPATLKYGTVTLKYGRHLEECTPWRSIHTN